MASALCAINMDLLKGDCGLTFIDVTQDALIPNFRIGDQTNLGTYEWHTHDPTWTG